MNTNIIIATCLLVLFSGTARAQFSAYTSASYGYHDNPLYNYEAEGDQLQQHYLEIKYKSTMAGAPWQLMYAGGLTLFRQIQERNYYEHSLSSLSQFNIGGPSRQILATENHDGAGNEESVTSPRPSPDSSGWLLTLPVTLSARHDKSAFDEFDNIGFDLDPSARVFVGEATYLHLASNTGYRGYTNIGELSNVFQHIQASLGIRPFANSDYRAGLGGGIRHYVKTVYDTSRFEVKRSYVEKPSGKGKPGAKIIVPSSKEILTNPETKTIIQMSGSVNLRNTWDPVTLELEVAYRHNFTSTGRYIAQFVNSTFLNDDIYTDYFSYSGLDVVLTYSHTWPWEIESIMTAQCRSKTFGAPAQNLVGEETDAHRKDLRIGCEVYLQKFINLSDNMGMGFYVAGSAMRNQSNDMYNDFSLWNIAAGLAVGIY